LGRFDSESAAGSLAGVIPVTGVVEHDHRHVVRIARRLLVRRIAVPRAPVGRAGGAVERRRERHIDADDALVAMLGCEEDARRDQRPRALLPRPVGECLLRELCADLRMRVPVRHAVGDRAAGGSEHERAREHGKNDCLLHPFLP